MWVYGGGSPDKPVIWYQYADTRSGDVPLELMHSQERDSINGEMYLVTDGYDGYNPLSRTPCIMGHAACWAHVRDGLSRRLMAGRTRRLPIRWWH